MGERQDPRENLNQLASASDDPQSLAATLEDVATLGIRDHHVLSVTVGVLKHWAAEKSNGSTPTATTTAGSAPPSVQETALDTIA
jgi:hypothetical protein